MAESVGDVLRSIRVAARLSTAALAARAYTTKQLISYVETGKRRATPELAAACDRALGTTPLLTTLVGLEMEGDVMRRRTLLAGITTAGGAGLPGLEALAGIVRNGLLDNADQPTDWDAVVGDYARRLAVDPSPAYGQSLVGQLMVARQQLADKPTPEITRAAAQLGQLYGLWRGNAGDIPDAWGWYRTATALADRAGDKPVQVWTRGRTASRSLYEGATVTETVTRADEALTLSRLASLGAVEAYSALVHVHALTGDLAAGRQAVGGMRDLAEHLPDAETPGGAVQRTMQFAHYLECRTGPWPAVQRVWADAEPLLRGLPVWHADAKIYYGLAMVRAGDVADGIRYALLAARTLPGDVRIVGLGVADLLAVVPAGHRSDELDELRGYAAPGPHPWETLAV
jgi:transcriptional regulator with XRE-family HTH domain